MPDYLELRVDKFIFRIAQDRSYSREGLWIKQEDAHLRIGLSDYLQQRSGDVAFVEVKPEGTSLQADEEIAVIETIKVNFSLSLPMAVKVIRVNPELESSPESINQDPYESGWLALVAPSGGVELKDLMSPQDYFTQVKREAEQEVK